MYISKISFQGSKIPNNTKTILQANPKAVKNELLQITETSVDKIADTTDLGKLIGSPLKEIAKGQEELLQNTSEFIKEAALPYKITK